jgi:hypothetical protein
MPLALSDQELDAVFELARPIAPELRPEFLHAVAAQLAASGAERGAGSLHRVAAELQGQFIGALQQAAEAESPPRYTFNRARVFSKLQEL